MASTSISSGKKRFTYDVFLSFRGEDTRNNFVDHLYHAFHQKGIITYKDDERIKKGRRIDDQLTRSIEDSRFHIIVFSKNYAASSWCLDELVKIMECQRTTEQTAYPIFYDVKPTEVRKQSGAVEKAFAKHVGKEGADRWRDALKEAASLSGWAVDGREAKLIQIIMEEILPKLYFINLIPDKNLVGMESRVNKIVSSLEIGFDGVCMIGICGIGGGGKTTIANVVFDHISVWFDGVSFVENVRVVSKNSSGLRELQQKVLSDVLNDQSVVVKSVFDGKNKMQRMMANRKVLVVLDDVDHIDQLEALVGNPNWFKPGSRIIITTRDEQVLVPHRVNFIHHVNLLSHEEARCLFCKYAFGTEIPNQGYEELLGKVVQYADGLPLVIKVLGSFLCGKTDREWNDAIERLKTIPLHETLKKLELSYDGLEKDYKEMFLDVACILKGMKKKKAISILKSCGFHAEIGLRVLELKSLISISDNSCLHLHDRLEEMGKDIVRRLHPEEPNKHTRLWITEEIEDIFAEDLGNEVTRSIKLQHTNLHPTIIIKGLRKMKKLKVLYVDTPFGEVGEVGQYLPHTLRSLYWRGYPLGCLPNTLPNKECYIKLKYLKYLNLSGSKVGNLNLGLAPHLESLTMTMIDTKHFPDSICVLKHLKYLKLKSCCLLEQLPDDICRLKFLEELHLMDCAALENIPNSICTMTCLKYLHLPYVGVRKLPKELGSLKSLEELNIEGACITHLPNSIFQLKDLRIIWSTKLLESYNFASLKDISRYTASCFVYNRVS